MTLDGSARFLCEEILVVVDSGRGLSNLDDLFDLASNKRAERQSQARGIHGMGAKNAIDRLGRHAIVVSKCTVISVGGTFFGGFVPYVHGKGYLLLQKK